MMQDRVTALRQAIVFEPHVYRHIVGSILINPAADGSYAAESNFHILRTGADGTVVTYGCGRYLDEIVQYRGDAQFRKRTVVLDSSRIDTLLVIPLSGVAMIEFLMIAGAPQPVAPFSHATATDG